MSARTIGSKDSWTSQRHHILLFRTPSTGHLEGNWYLEKLPGLKDRLILTAKLFPKYKGCHMCEVVSYICNRISNKIYLGKICKRMK